MELWATENGRVEADAEGVLRWELDAGKNAALALRPTHPLFARLKDFNRFEFEFRIAGGRVDHLNFVAQGHVSGTRRYKVFEWQLAASTTPRDRWLVRLLDLERPNWFPWDKPEGNRPRFQFDAVALEPGTVIELRNLRLMAPPLAIKPFFEFPITWPRRSEGPEGGVTYTFTPQVLNISGGPLKVTAKVVSQHKHFTVAVEPASLEVENGKVAEFKVTATMTAKEIAATPELFSESVRIAFAANDTPETASAFEMTVTRPLSKAITQPFVLSEADREYVRAKGMDPEVRKALGVDAILREADKFLNVRLEHIPTGHMMGRMNFWPTVPGSQPPARYQIGEAMPEIVNPVTGEKEMGTELAGRVWKEYLGLSGQVTEKLGLAYFFTGDEKYAAKAVELLELWAKQYGELDWAVQWEVPWSNGPAQLSSSRLAGTSSYGGNFLMRWTMRMLGLIADSPSLTPEARQRIYEGFILPYATESAKFPGGINNMSDIANHNLLVMGLVFDDANLVRQALATDAGLLARLGDIDADGFSSEGRPPNYHLAGMNEYLPAIAYLLNSGLKIDIPKERLLAALRMPYERATLWGVIPNTGDCGRGGFRVGASSQADEIVSLFPKESWLGDIARGGSLPAKIRNLQTGHVPDKEAWRGLLDTKPRLFRDAGFAILRSGDTPETQIMATLDYGRNLMHAHLDRNQITLAAFGKIFTHGPGTLYNLGGGSGVIPNPDPKLQSFCRAGSLGQNVVLVDAQDQQPAIGELVSWSDDPANQHVTARVAGIAPGVSHTRTLALRDGLVILIDRMEAETERDFDFVHHNFGKLSLGAGWHGTPEKNPLAESANYPNLEGLERLTGAGPLHLTWDLTNELPPPAKDKAPAEHPQPLGLALWQLPVGGSSVFTASTGLNNPNTFQMPAAAPSLITRAHGKSATFVTVLEPFKEGPTVTSIEGNSETLIIHRGGNRIEIHPADFLVNPPDKNAKHTSSLY